MESNFVCCLCSKIPSNVVESACCNSLYCWDCIVAEPAGQECPSCGLQLDPATCIENLAVRKIIDGIQVKCNFAGCLERMMVSERNAHESTCNKGPALCPNSELCGIMDRGSVAQHLLECQYRRIVCHMCEISLPLPHLQEHLDTTCQEVAAECPNLCHARVVRKNIAAHIATACPYTELECPFAGYGCTVKPRRSTIASHLADETAMHMGLMANAIQSQQIQINTLREQLAMTQEATSQIPPNSGVVYQLDQCLTQVCENVKNTDVWNHPCVRKLRNSATPVQLIGSFLIIFFIIRLLAFFILPYFLYKLVKWGVAAKVGCVVYRVARRNGVNRALCGIGIALMLFFFVV